MRLLVLGGTKNLGRHVVEAALADGHEVTLFNRGQTNPGLFPSVRRIVGDRGAPEALAAGEWDGVIDMSGLLVRDVTLSASVLRDRCGHYTYMSSIAVYASKTTPGMTESAQLLPWPAGAPEDHFTMDLYGPSKVRNESSAPTTPTSATGAGPWPTTSRWNAPPAPTSPSSTSTPATWPPSSCTSRPTASPAPSTQ
jgi:2'-hydroxyisoflavone reductase